MLNHHEIARALDERAATLLLYEISGLNELAHGAANGDATDAVLLAQLGLGGNLVADLILAGIDSVLDITNNLQVQGHKRRCHHLLCHMSRTSRFRLIAMSPTQQ